MKARHRAVVYSRISRDRVGAGLGVERQEADCRLLAEARGLTITAVYRDNDISASSGKRRPGYRQMLEDARSGAFDTILAWHTDRLHRSNLELEEFIPVLEAQDITVQTVREGLLDLSTPSGRMVARILAATARHEAEMTSERIRRKHRELARRGLPAGGGKRPYGYGRDGVTVIEEEAAVIREAAERALADDSLRSICSDLQARGIPSATGRYWTTRVMKNVLTSPRMAGLRSLRGEVTQAVWPGILDATTVEALRVRLRPSKDYIHARRPRALLTSLLLCGGCGQRMVSKNPKATVRGYACPVGPDHRGCGISIRADPLERHIEAAAFSEIERSGVLGTLHPQTDTVELQTAADELAASKDRMRELGGLYAAGKLTADAWLTALAPLEGTIHNLEERMASSRAALARPQLLGDLSNLRKRYECSPTEVRRFILRLVIERIEIEPIGKGVRAFNPGRVRIKWRT